MPEGDIVIKGARQHNLRSIDLTIPRNRMIVITGLSGSGKSSLAFDTLYAEGQRRFIESLSSYARQFLGVMDKPDVDSIEGLSPSISIEQHAPSRNPRSTVATTTEIHDHLRLLFARIGIPHCPVCGREIEKQSQDRIIQKIMEINGREVRIIAPIVRGRKGAHKDIFKELKKDGFIKVVIDEKAYRLGDVPDLDKNKKHSIGVLIDTLFLDEEHLDQLTEDISLSLGLSEGTVVVEELDNGKVVSTDYYSEKMACPVHGISIPELEPRMFSFNSPFGACKDCHGLGQVLDVDPDLIIPDKTRSIAEGAIALFRSDPEGSL